MRYLQSIEQYSISQPNAPAIRTSAGEHMSYAELWQASEAIAALVELCAAEGSGPVIVYGHKDPLMVASFLGCMKAGHPYVPVDRFSVPAERVASIAGQLEDPLVIAVDELPEALAAKLGRVVSPRELRECVAMGASSKPGHWIKDEDLCYILFTSGSTGTPKGVEVTAACFDNFCSWSQGLGGERRDGRVYLDQAPFSFDLSVFELAGALSTGGSLFSLVHETQQSARDLLDALASSGANVWVSTPSFAELCLANAAFDEELMRALELFVFCGETLANKTALRLMERFPGAVVVNTYGPTESTVAVTEVVVTPEIARLDAPLPVGLPREGTRLRIQDESGRDVGAHCWGEVVIEGDTVARGYHGRPDLSARSFGTVELDGRVVRTYRTGDEGRLDELGMLHYRGRLDLQVKVNGFRIELGEIEERLRRLPGVSAAAVSTAGHGGKVSHLIAHLVADVPEGLSPFRAGLAVKEQLKEVLPHYMIPKKVVFHDSLPMTGNGKVDRRALADWNG